MARHYYLGPKVLSLSEPMGPTAKAPAGAICALNIGPWHQDAPLAFFGFEEGQSLGADYVFVGEGLDGAIPDLAAVRERLNAPIAATTVIDAIGEYLTEHADPEGEYSVFPLRPNADGTVTIHLLNHSPVWTRRLDMTQARARGRFWHDYRRVYEDAIAGRMLRPQVDSQGRMRTVVDRSFHRRTLQAWLEKYGRLGLTREFFLPPEFSDHTPLPHSTTLNEDWSAAGDSSDISNTHTWIDVAGDHIISGGEVTLAGNGSGRNWSKLESDFATDDHEAQETVTGLSGSTGNRIPGVAVRWNGGTTQAGSTFYLCGGWENNSEILLRTWNGSAFGDLTGSPSAHTFGAEPWDAQVQADDDQISCTIDGASIGPVTDSTYSGQTRAGLINYTDGDRNITVNPYASADLAGGGGGAFTPRMSLLGVG